MLDFSTDLFSSESSDSSQYVIIPESFERELDRYFDDLEKNYRKDLDCWHVVGKTDSDIFMHFVAKKTEDEIGSIYSSGWKLRINVKNEHYFKAFKLILPMLFAQKNKNKFSFKLVHPSYLYLAESTSRFLCGTQITIYIFTRETLRTTELPIDIDGLGGPFKVLQPTTLAYPEHMISLLKDVSYKLASENIDAGVVADSDRRISNYISFTFDNYCSSNDIFGVNTEYISAADSRCISLRKLMMRKIYKKNKQFFDYLAKILNPSRPPISPGRLKTFWC